MKKEVVVSYSIKCIGSSTRKRQLDANLTTVDVSLTIYKDGNRDVGCSYVSDNNCIKFGCCDDNGRCKHLFP